MKYSIEIIELDINLLRPGQFQPRRDFDQTLITELTESIKVNGLIQPIVVRPMSSATYEIVAGERRWRAACAAGLQTIGCLINEYTDEQAAMVAMAENINRVDLNPIEEALSYHRLIEEFSYQHDEVAAIVGKSRVTISNSLRLLKLETSVRQHLIDGTLTEGHGKILASFTYDQQLAWSDVCLKKKLSVRQLTQAIRHERNQLTKVPKKLDKQADIAYLERHLGDYLGCNVHIIQNNKRCLLQLECYNLEILDSILKKMGYNLENNM